MAGGITTKAQPLDIFVEKVLKILYQDLYDEYLIHSPDKITSGNTFIRQGRELLNGKLNFRKSFQRR